IKLAPHGSETGLNVAQAFAIGQLREGHGQILVPAGEAAQVRVATVTSNTLLEFLVGKVLNQLRENSAACVHASLFRRCRADDFDFRIVPEVSGCIMLKYKQLRQFHKK